MTNLVIDANTACAIERFDRPPHLRSDAVVLKTATSGDAADKAAQQRTDRWFVAALVFLALCAAPFIWS